MDKQAQINAILQKYGHNPSQPIQGGGISSFNSKLDAIKTGADVQKESIGKIVADVFTGSTQAFGKSGGEVFSAGKNIKDFESAAKSSNDLQLALTKQIQTDKAVGKDTSKLEQSLKDLQVAQPSMGQYTGVEDITGKQVAGQALGTALEATSGGLIEGGAKNAVSKTASLLEKIKSGAKVGSAYGAAGGLSQGLQQDKDAMGIVGDVATGAAIGGALGGVLPAVGTVAPAVVKQLGNIPSKVKSVASKVIPTTEQTILDIVTPELSTKKVGQAIRSGRGKIDAGTIFDTVSITPDSKINKAFEATKDILKPNATITENTNIVRDALGVEAESLKSKIQDVPSIFTFKELNSALNKVELPISFKADAQSKVLKKVTSAAMDIAKKQKGKLGGLLDARKEFDRLVEENFPNLYEAGKPTPAYNAITKTRNALNDFIEAKLPDGFGYKESLRKQSAFYDALDAMESKAAKEVGQPTNKYVRKVQQIMKNNPKTTRALKYGASGTAVIGGAKAILGN